VNLDGVPDYAIGSLAGAYVFWFGPGIVRVYSGKDGSMIRQIFGSEECNSTGDFDAFGNFLANAGDTNGDGVPDLLAVAWNWHDVGYANIYSGKDASLLHTFRGDDGWGAPVVSRAGTAGDLDHDGCSDVFVGRGRDGSEVYSGKTWAKLFDSHTATGSQQWVIDKTLKKLAGDVDGDGVDDWIDIIPSIPEHFGVRLGRRGGDVPEQPHRVEIHSGADGHLLRSIGADLPAPWLLDRAGAAGDIDGDHVPDLWICYDVGDDVPAFEDESRPTSWPATNPPGRTRNPRRLLRIISGRDGSEIGRVMCTTWSFAKFGVVGVGDLDGDGRGELLVGDYESWVNGPCAGSVYVLSFPAKER
jgi:hypothetical protein